MGAMFRSWWQQVKQRRVTILVVAIILVVVIAFIFAAYRFGWSGTGFLNKTLWDWLQLLIIPLVLAIAALLFNLATTRNEQKIATKRYEQDQKIALDKQREDLLQGYLDRMSELLLEKQLGTSASEEVRNVARVRTITVLIQLDARRISYVFAFLRQAGLMTKQLNNNVISLNDADFSNVNWSEADLSEVNLSGADLFRADLSRTILSGANLSKAGLDGANLEGAFLEETDLSEAYINEVNLSFAHLNEANLSNAKLQGAILNDAYLFDADLSRANLTGARVTEEQLKKAKSLQGATMPDGSIHP